jgi:hypothetical protein
MNIRGSTTPGPEFTHLPPKVNQARSPAQEIQSHSLGGGRNIEEPQPQWSHDQGEADPNLMQALHQEDSALIVNALSSSRVLVALVKSTVVQATQGGSGDKTSDMSVACLTASDGRVGLLAFTSVESLKLWNTEARPIPVAGKEAGIAALDESASALIIDPAGPTPFTLTLPDLVALTGVDQRWRAVAHIEQLLEAAGIGLPIFALATDGPIVIKTSPDLGERIAELLVGRGDIHAFTPHGIAIEIISD